MELRHAARPTRSYLRRRPAARRIVPLRAANRRVYPTSVEPRKSADQVRIMLGRFLEARGGIEPPIKVLQTFALPLGDRALAKCPADGNFVAHHNIPSKRLSSSVFALFARPRDFR